MKYRTLTPSSVFPCTVAFLKDQLRITHTAHDSYLESLIAAATDWANGFTGRQINYATLLGYCSYLNVRNHSISNPGYSGFENPMYLGFSGAGILGRSGRRHLFIASGPIIAVTKIEYLDTSGALITIPSDKYDLSRDEYSAAIFLKSDFEYINIDTRRPDAIQITFTAGYGGTATGAIVFPEIVKNAVALKAARMYTNPEDGVDEKVSVSENLLKSMRCPIV